MMNLDGFLKPRLRGKSNKLVRWPDRWFDCPTFVLKLNQVQFEAFSDFTDYNLVSDKKISKINSRIKTKFKLKMDLRISRNKKWNFEKLSFESWVDSLFLVNRECCWTRKLRACHCLARLSLILRPGTSFSFPSSIDSRETCRISAFHTF